MTSPDVGTSGQDRTPVLPFTQAWADRFHEAINADPRYRTDAAQWTWPVALVLAAEPALGWPEDAAVQVELDRGTSRGARALPAAAADAPFVLRAPYATWKQIVRGALDPVQAAMKGQLTLVRGSFATLLMQTAAAQALCRCAQQVPTLFPDETG